MDWSYVAGSLLGTISLAGGFLAGRWVYNVKPVAVAVVVEEEEKEDPYLTEEQIREIIAEQVMDEQEEYPCDPDDICEDTCPDCDGYWTEERYDAYWQKIAETCEFRRWALDALSEINDLEEAQKDG